MNTINITLKVWRQRATGSKGDFETYEMDNINSHMSFLELLDVLNERLIKDDKDPIAFEHDCREGICGSCAMSINGEAHGPVKETTACQLHMFNFKDGDTITAEPWRAESFPILKDLVTDRSSFDRIIQAGGYISVNTGSAPDGNAIPIAQDIAQHAFDAAACIGCGACVSTCKNSSANLFVSAKIAQFSSLPQGEPEQRKRVLKMVHQMDEEGFGHCTNTGACEATCPKEISTGYIEEMNREYIKASLK